MINNNSDTEKQLAEVIKKLERLELKHQEESRVLKDHISILESTLRETLEALNNRQSVETEPPIEAHTVHLPSSSGNERNQTTQTRGCPRITKGVRVRIINNYKGYQGTVGKVTRVSKSGQTVWLRDSGNRNHQRSILNVEIVD